MTHPELDVASSDRPLVHAHGAVLRARQRVDEVRAAVGCREEGAAALTAAEYELQLALRAVDRLRGWTTDETPGGS